MRVLQTFPRTGLRIVWILANQTWILFIISRKLESPSSFFTRIKKKGERTKKLKIELWTVSLIKREETKNTLKFVTVEFTFNIIQNKTKQSLLDITSSSKWWSSRLGWCNNAWDWFTKWDNAVSHKPQILAVSIKATKRGWHVLILTKAKLIPT